MPRWSHLVIEEDGRGVRLGLENIERYAAWMQAHEAEHIVARTTVGDFEVCTDFLGINLEVWDDDQSRPPLCYETMVFPAHQRLDNVSGTTRRYRTRADALSGHAAVVAGLVG